MRDTPSIRLRARRALLPALLLLALAPLIAACEITFSGRVDVEPNPGFRVTSASFRTDYRATVDGVESFVICDDRQTNLTYTFRYEGELSSWRSYLSGVTTGARAGDVTLRPGDPAVQQFTSSSVTVNYLLMPESAPLLQAPDAAGASGTALPTADITVVPVPRVIGYTRLYLQAQGHSAYQFPTSRSSDRIPVIDNCD